MNRALLAAVLVACGPWGDHTAAPAPPDANDPKYRMFASYFQHVERKVYDAWHPAEVLRVVDPTGAIYGHANRITRVGVCLSRDGHLVGVMVTFSSSIRELDAEALRAFSAAAPFARVPSTLVDGLGRMTFSFTFDFELAARGLGTPRPKT